ncbi:MAG: hypothetical protein NWF01_05895 [Candidatus Bathyarchaeota archaeon]|nr:hypothetical protein [Candidatus Bathyarchaeota archaeon]
MSKKTKKPPPHFSTRSIEKETDDTYDIYNSKQREQMLDDDEITVEEEAFMRGRDEAYRKKKLRQRASHVDSVSVELAKEDAEDS